MGPAQPGPSNGAVGGSGGNREGTTRDRRQFVHVSQRDVCCSRRGGLQVRELHHEIEGRVHLEVERGAVRDDD